MFLFSFIIFLCHSRTYVYFIQPSMLILFTVSPPLFTSISCLFPLRFRFLLELIINIPKNIMHWTEVPTTKSYVPGFVHSLTELHKLVMYEQNAAGLLCVLLPSDILPSLFNGTKFGFTAHRSSAYQNTRLLREYSYM